MLCPSLQFTDLHLAVEVTMAWKTCDSDLEGRINNSSQKTNIQKICFHANMLITNKARKKSPEDIRYVGRIIYKLYYSETAQEASASL